MFIAHHVLADDWEFYFKIVAPDCHFGLAGGNVENPGSEGLLEIAIKKWMLIFKI